jgi:hypothetical protein
MEIITSTTEQTTAATDFILFILAIWAVITIRSAGKNVEKTKANIWIWVFILLAIAALFGAVAHGFQMDEKTNYLLWQPLNLALGLGVSLFAVAAIYDMLNGSLPRLAAPGLISLGIIFYFITVFFPGSFLIFIVYEAVVMIFAIVAYTNIAIKGQIQGAWWMVAGILITIIAAAVQASNTLLIRIIWEFDHNGIFHIIQMAGIVVLVKGLLIYFKSEKTSQN